MPEVCAKPSSSAHCTKPRMFLLQYVYVVQLLVGKLPTLSTGRLSCGFYVDVYRTDAENQT